VADTRASSAGVRAGFVAMLPLWSGVVPFALAFAVLAHAAGFSTLQTQALSLFVFAGSAQVAIVTLTLNGASGFAIVLTTLLLNLRHVLYGLSLSRLIPQRTRPPKSILAFILTDEAYGVALRAFLDGRGSVSFLVGAASSLYLSWNAATLAGSLLGRALPDVRSSGIDFVFPLTFLALLLPLLHTRRQVMVAILSGAMGLVLSRFVAGGTVILLSAITAAGIGTALELSGSSHS